jgi:hypothetical protein
VDTQAPAAGRGWWRVLVLDRFVEDRHERVEELLQPLAGDNLDVCRPATRTDARGHAGHWSLRPKRRKGDGERVMRRGVGVLGQAVGVAFGGVGRPFEEAHHGVVLAFG